MKAHPAFFPLALLLAFGGACTNETVKQVEAMASRACECRDAACADKVEKEFWEYAKGNQKRGTQEERDEIKAHYNRMRECIAKARTGTRGQPNREQPAGATPPAAGATTEAK
ncbi:MAG TPA: hypothetical protein VK698_13795 [Kofleriaceae bacterium]|jgi:hypothetical protein|nr:hypothetical protein [Kofleriaceae bacterium]